MSEVPLYPLSGDGAKLDPKEVLGTSWDPEVGPMSPLAT